MPLHTSLASGCIAELPSLQSVLFATKPVGTEHACVVIAALPKPSASLSLKNATSTPSSICPLQLSSILLHTSFAPGWMTELPSLQSALLATKPAGEEHACCVTAALPNPSLSESWKKVNNTPSSI